MATTGTWGSTCPPAGVSETQKLAPLALCAEMEWAEGDHWHLGVELPPGRHEFKVIVAKKGGEVDWETGDNRVLEVRHLRKPEGWGDF